jgi:hypothetical protein
MEDINREVDFSKFKCRCSAISKILSNSRDNPVITEKQSILLADLEKKPVLTDKQADEMARLIVLRENKDKIILSDTCIDYLMEVYAWETEGMIPVSKESMDLLAIRKGKECQTEGIEMMSILFDEAYTENKERIYSEYLSGEPDAFTGRSILEATHISDQKNMWDYPIFLKNLHKTLENGYTQQVQGYGDIANCKSLSIDKVLCSNPPEIIEDMKFKIAKKFGAVTVESPDFLKEWEKWERSMVFDHIPIIQRVHRIKVEPFTESEKQQVYDRVKICREWLCHFHEIRVQLLN